VLRGSKSICLKKDRQFTPKIEISTEGKSYDWLRIGITAKELEKEWSIWRNAQLIVELWQNDNKVDQEMIRIQRLLPDNNARDIYMDVENKKTHNKVKVYIWHAESQTHFVLDNLKIESFSE